MTIAQVTKTNNKVAGLKRSSITQLWASLIIAVLGIFAAIGQSTAGETVTYYHVDALGSPVAATDSSANVIWRDEYDAYGDRIRDEGSTNNNLWYTGKFHEQDIGLTYFGARWYDPVAGRFMGVDPVEFQEGNIHSFNRYAYANNNPYMFVDPDGRAAETALDVVSFGLSLNEFRKYPSFLNGLGLAYDGVAMAVPFLPAGFGIIKNADRLADAAKGIPDEAFVVRGGVATPEQIAKGISDHRDVPGLTGFSAQSRAEATVEELAATGGVGGGPFPHRQVSVTTAGQLRCVGCDVVASPGGGANHVTVVPGRATPAEISEQFKQRANPAK